MQYAYSYFSAFNSKQFLHATVCQPLDIGLSIDSAFFVEKSINAHLSQPFFVLINDTYHCIRAIYEHITVLITSHYF